MPQYLRTRIIHVLINTILQLKEDHIILLPFFTLIVYYYSLIVIAYVPVDYAKRESDGKLWWLD